MLRNASFAAMLLTWVALALPGSADAPGQELVPKLAGPKLLEAMKAGGYTILMRHAATENFAIVPDEFDLDDCDTQRGLSAEGQQQAKDMGEAMKALGIRIGEVYVSPYCRCQETGQIAFGKAEVSWKLIAVDQLSPAKKQENAKQVRGMLDQTPAPGTNNVMITHTGTLLYSFGLQTRPEGIIHVFKPTGLGLGRPSYMGKVMPDEWSAILAQHAADS